MNRDTARAILAAAALMTVQALLLAVLAASTAHASTVYRCPAPSAGDAVIYQAQPCSDSTGVPVRAADTRTREQQSQAGANHARQMAWLDRQGSQAPSSGKPKAPSKKRKRPHKASHGAAHAQANVAVPLTSHRLGQRPFEGRGQEIAATDRSVNKPRKGRRSPYDLLARAPSSKKAHQQAGSVSLKPSP